MQLHVCETQPGSQARYQASPNLRLEKRSPLIRPVSRIVRRNKRKSPEEITQEPSLMRPLLPLAQNGLQPTAVTTPGQYIRAIKSPSLLMALAT